MKRTDKEWMMWFVTQYDKHVSGNPADGVTLKDSRDAVAKAYAQAVKQGGYDRWQVDPLVEGTALFSRAVNDVRKGRRRNLSSEGKYLLSALRDETILGPADPQLDQAYGMGENDGRDKTLRYWTRDDWEQARTERYRNAADVTHAASEFDREVAAPFIEALTTLGVRTTGELFTKDDK